MVADGLGHEGLADPDRPCGITATSNTPSRASQPLRPSLFVVSEVAYSESIGCQDADASKSARLDSPPADSKMQGTYDFY